MAGFAPTYNHLTSWCGRSLADSVREYKCNSLSPFQDRNLAAQPLPFFTFIPLNTGPKKVLEPEVE